MARFSRTRRVSETRLLAHVHSGSQVESCLIGAPAWNSEQMDTGDVLEEVHYLHSLCAPIIGISTGHSGGLMLRWSPQVDDQAVDDATVQM